MSPIIKRAPVIFSFGAFRLNVLERLLLRDEEVVRLTPKAFDTLVVLVENAGHILSKDELLTTLWPGSFVEESSLAKNISLLRRALGEDTASPSYIETVPKLGYRFIASVKELSEDDREDVGEQQTDDTVQAITQESRELVKAPLTTRRFGLRQIAALSIIFLAAILLVVYLQLRPRESAAERGTIKSVAVLPFVTLDVKDEKEMLGVGIADAVIIQLSKQEKLLILPTSRIYRYKDRQQEVLSIGRELGVDAVLDGVVQRSGRSIRVTAQLIRIVDGKTLWADKFYEEESNIFAVQDAVAAKLAATLDIEMISKR
ncbi:MAG TPA: winged helix-turn-helix domain-containing protein [Pyrinomonadaceae bacterium]|nr:winged helix-turn-helix domain-containing protein [Pyrinomonadaceae bacterium]